MKAKSFTLLFLLSIFSSSAFSQRIFAGRVLNVGSEYNAFPDAWSAYEALGVPNVYPAHGDIEDAWTPTSYGSQRDFIELGFDNNGPIDSIFIYQTNEPGFIDSVFVRDPGDLSWDLVYSAVPAYIGDTAIILSIGFPITSYNVNQIRITIANDISTNWVEFDAVAISPATVNAFVAETTPGNALSFDGVDDYFHTCSSMMNLITDSAATLAAWINIDTGIVVPTVVTPFDGIQVMGDSYPSEFGIYLANLGGGDSLYATVDDGSILSLGMDYTPGQWMHVAITLDNNLLKVYKNGTLFSSIACGNLDYIQAGELCLAINYNSSYFFQGIIDEVATFNRGISAVEMTDLMRIDVSETIPGMTGYWQMDDCSSISSFNPFNHIADSLMGVSCIVSTIPDFAGISNTGSSNTSISLYPNPSSGESTLDLKQIEGTQVSVYDLAGRIIYRKDMNEKTVHNIQLTNAIPGIYYVVVTDLEQKTHSLKWLIR